MRRIAVSELIIDKAVYPRIEVDGDHVFNMVEAMRTGVKFPPPVICGKSLRVVDGAHRVTAMQRLYGSQFEADVLEKQYTSDAELFLDAMKYNAGNGRNLTSDDRRRCSNISAALNIDSDRVAKALSISKSFLGGLSSAAKFNDGEGLTRGQVSGQLASRRAHTQHSKARSDVPANSHVVTVSKSENLPRQRRQPGSITNVREKWLDLAYLVDDCADAIENSELDFSKVHKMSQLHVAAARLSKLFKEKLGVPA